MRTFKFNDFFIDNLFHENVGPCDSEKQYIILNRIKAKKEEVLFFSIINFGDFAPPPFVHTISNNLREIKKL